MNIKIFKKFKIETNDFLYILYLLSILSITVFLAIQILKMGERRLSYTGKSIEIVERKIQERQLIDSLLEFQKCEDLHTQEFRNLLGFKDIEWGIEKPNNTYRIIALGDSMTEGAFLNNNVTWPKQLEKKLNEYSSSTKFEVFNMAGSGHGESACTLDELEILKDVGLKYNPDMVILQYYNNDWYSPHLKKKIVKLWEMYKRGDYKLPKNLEDKVKQLNASDPVVSRLIAHIVLQNYFDTVDWEEEWDRWVRGPIMELIKTCRDNNIKLIVITWDLNEQKEKLVPLLEYYNIPFYDFSDYLPTHPCPSIIRLPDCHLTALGYEIVANKTLDIVIGEFE